MSVLQVVSLDNARGTPVIFKVPFVVQSLAISQCSCRAAILSSDGRVFTCIADLPNSMRIVGFPSGVAFPIKNIAISPDGRYLASVDARGRLFMEDIDGQKPMTRVAAIDQVASVSIIDRRVIALDVAGHVWTFDADSNRARRITDKTSAPIVKIAASAIHVLTLGKSDRAVRRCSFNETDSTIAPLMIPGVDTNVTLHSFPVNVSAGDDFLVSSGSDRLYWLTVQLERFHLKLLDLPPNFSFRDVHVTVRGIFFIGVRGDMHRLDWQVIKQNTKQVTIEMLIPFTVTPTLIDQKMDDKALPDARPDKVAFGLVHALFLWVENEPDRGGELKALMFEISAVLEETQALKQKISATLPPISLTAERDVLLRDALVREVDREKSVHAKKEKLRSLGNELAETIDTRTQLTECKRALERELAETLKPQIQQLKEDNEALQSLKHALQEDMQNLEPVIEELSKKIKETGGNYEKKERVKEDLTEIDLRLLHLAKELKDKKVALSQLATQRETAMQMIKDLAIKI